MRYGVEGSGEVDDGDSGTAEAHVFIVEGVDGGVGLQKLPYGCAESAGTGAMQNAYSVGTELYGIVDEIGYGLKRFVDTHATYIQLAGEVELPVAACLIGAG